MKVHHLIFLWNKVLVGTLFFLFGASFANGQTAVKVTLLDNTEQNYSIETTGKLWFNSSDLVINTNDALTPSTIPLAEIRKITFGGNGTPTAVGEVVDKKEIITIFPNPANNYFDIEATGAKELHVRIFNTNGSQVSSGDYISGNRVNVSHLTAGIYVVVINNQSFKFIKQ